MKKSPFELTEIQEPKILYQPTEIYKTYSEIPRILINHYLRANTNKKGYLKNTVNGFLRLSGNVDYIDLGFVEKKKNESVKEAIKRQRIQTLNYDDNLDGVVSYAEIEDHIKTKNRNLAPNRYKQALEDLIKQFEKQDKNRDKIVSNDEMIVLDKDVQKRVEEQVLKQYQPYLDIDPNKDSRVTKDELSELAEKAFNTIDLNRDGKLEAIEISKYKSGLASQTFSDKK